MCLNVTVTVCEYAALNVTVTECEYAALNAALHNIEKNCCNMSVYEALHGGSGTPKKNHFINLNKSICI